MYYKYETNCNKSKRLKNISIPPNNMDNNTSANIIYNIYELALIADYVFLIVD